MPTETIFVAWPLCHVCNQPLAQILLVYMRMWRRILLKISSMLDYSNKIKTPESSILGNANKIKPIFSLEKKLLNFYPVKSEYYDHNDHIIPENRICNERWLPGLCFGKEALHSIWVLTDYRKSKCTWAFGNPPPSPILPKKYNIYSKESTWSRDGKSDWYQEHEHYEADAQDARPAIARAQRSSCHHHYQTKCCT